MINDPKNYELTDQEWEDFINYVEGEFDSEKRDEPYSAVSIELLKVLESALEEDGLLSKSQSIIDSLHQAVSSSIAEDIRRNEGKIRKALEEEIVFHKTNTTGLFEYQLPRDPNTQKALELLETGEYKNILVGPAE